MLCIGIIDSGFYCKINKRFRFEKHSSFLIFVSLKSKLIHIPIVLCALILTTASNCKKKEDPKLYIGNFPATEVMKYLYFKPGSYWIYECDSTLEIDSQVMVKVDTPWQHLNYIDYQYVFYNKKSITYNVAFNTINFGTNIPYSKDRVGIYYFANSLAISGPNISASDCVFFYPFDSSLLGGYGSSPTYYKGFLDSMKVLDRWYKDVRVFQVQYAGGFIEPKIKTWGDGQITYYWARNIGIIRTHVWTKKDGLNSTFKFNWNLKRHKIIQ